MLKPVLGINVLPPIRDTLGPSGLVPLISAVEAVNCSVPPLHWNKFGFPPLSRLPTLSVAPGPRLREVEPLFQIFIVPVTMRCPAVLMLIVADPPGALEVPP